MDINNNAFDFEPPFADNGPTDEISDTYQPITVNLSAADVEFLQELLILYITDNADFLNDSDWQQIEVIQNILKPGIISGNPNKTA